MKGGAFGKTHSVRYCVGVHIIVAKKSSFIMDENENEVLLKVSQFVENLDIGNLNCSEIVEKLARL